MSIVVFPTARTTLFSTQSFPQACHRPVSDGDFVYPALHHDRDMRLGHARQPVVEPHCILLGLRDDFCPRLQLSAIPGEILVRFEAGHQPTVIALHQNVNTEQVRDFMQTAEATVG